LTPEGSISSGASPAPISNAERAKKAISTFSLSDYLHALEDLDKEIPPIPPFSSEEKKQAIIIDNVLLNHEQQASPSGISGKIERFARKILDTPVVLPHHTGLTTPIITKPDSDVLYSERLNVHVPGHKGWRERYCMLVDSCFYIMQGPSKVSHLF
jgi:hypothetical protein